MSINNRTGIVPETHLQAEQIWELPGEWTLWYLPRQRRAGNSELLSAWRNYKLVSMVPRRKANYFLAIHNGSGIYARNQDYEALVRNYVVEFVEALRVEMFKHARYRHR